MAKKVKEPVVTLADIVAATQAGTIIYTFKEVHEPLVASCMVEINPAMVDGEAIATRATQAGIDAVASAVPVKLDPVKTKTEFVISEVPVPESGARSGRETVYPFDKLEVGQSFFVPNTENRPDAAKSLASTVSSAHARFSVVDPEGKTRIVAKGDNKGATVPVMVRTRTFTIRAVDGAPWGQAGVMGAGIWRTK